MRVAGSVLLVVLGFLGCAPGAVDEPRLPAGAACDASSECDDGLECAAGTCRVPAELLACCFGEEDGACAGTLDGEAEDTGADGCAAGLVCVGQLDAIPEGSPGAPICVHLDGRGEGERCHYEGDDCAAGLTCIYVEDVCEALVCESDDDCGGGGDVCVTGAVDGCRTSCAPPAQQGEPCFVEPIEGCGLSHACADGLVCDVVDDGASDKVCQ